MQDKYNICFVTNTDKRAKVQTNVFKCIQTLSNNTFVWTNIEQILQASTYAPFSLFFAGIYPFTASCDLHLTLAFNLSLTWTKKPEENAAEVHSIRSLFPLIYHNLQLKPRCNEDIAKTVTISIAFGCLKFLYIRVPL